MFDLDFIIQLSLLPVGIFFGIAKAALGAAGGGALGGLLGNRGSGGQSQTPSVTPQASKAVQDAPPPDAQQTAPEKAQPLPTQQPKQNAPIASQVLDNVDTPAGVVDSQKKNVDLNNLLDEEGTKPAADTPPPQAGEPIQPPDFTNKTDTDMPTAKQDEDTLGTVPQMERTEVLPNRIMDAGTNEQDFQYQEGMAAKQVDTGDAENPTLGYQYKQGTTVAGGLPRAKYRNR
jgi:hypothetical protein